MTITTNETHDEFYRDVAMAAAAYGGEPENGPLPVSREQLKPMTGTLQSQCVIPAWTAVYQTLSSSDWKEDSSVAIVDGSAVFVDNAILNSVRKREISPDSAVVEVRFASMGKKLDVSRKPVMRLTESL